MKKAPKRKGYVLGGSLIPDTPQKKPTRTYNNSNSAIAHDIALEGVDYVTGLANPNIIKGNDYQSEVGAKKYNQAARGGSNISAAVGGAILDYYIPGLGTGINTVRTTAGHVAGDNDPNSSNYDKDLSLKDNQRQDTAQVAIQTLGRSASGLKNIKPTNTNNPETEKQIKNTPATNAQLNTATGNNVSGIEQINADQLYGNALSDYNSAQTGEAKAMVLKNVNSGYYGNDYGLPEGMANGGIINAVDKTMPKKSKGGQIVGPGTSKSDSIDANVEDKGFIVPAENAHIAQYLRMKYLNDNPIKIAKV